MPSSTLLMPIYDLSLVTKLAEIRTHVSGVAPTRDHLKDALLTELPHRGLEADTSMVTFSYWLLGFLFTFI